MNGPISFSILRNTPYTYQFHATGQVYHSWYEIGAIASGGGTAYIELRQTGSNIVHILDYVLKSNSTNIEIKIYRGASFDPGTVRATWEPYNHRIIKSPSLEVYQDPTNIDLTGAEETFKSKGYGPAQGGQVSFSDIAPSSFLEEILAENEDYLIEIQNNGSSEREAFLHVAWYESGN